MFKNFSNFRLAMTLFLLIAGIIFALHHTSATSASSSAGTTSVIVELRGDPGAVYKARIQRAGGSVSNEQLQSYRNQLSVGQDQLLNDLKQRGVQFQVDSVDVNNFDGSLAGKVEYRYTLVLNAVTLTVPRAAIPTIESLPQVKKVHQNGYLHVALQKSVDYINAPKVYGRYQELTPTDNFNEGYEGQGINIAVLDTGIDWKHEMFGGDPTPPRLGILPEVAAVNTNKKVIYYLPLAGTVDDFGHGTHASADAAGYMGTAPGPDGIPGTTDDIRIHGVAPQARLMGYKVCTGTGSCLNAATILAIEDAVSPYTLKAVGSNTTGGDVPLVQKPIAHVINMSLGGAGGPDDTTALASDNATLMGTIVVASAGNDGPVDSTVGSPASGRRVIAVGADTDPGTGVNTADVVGGRTGMKAIAMDGSPAVMADIAQNFVYCGLAETIDTVPDNVSGKIAVIKRGSTINTPDLPVVGNPGLGTGLFQTKTYNATAKGAIAVIFVNNVDGELAATTVRKSIVPVFGMSRENGRYLLSLIGATPSDPDNATIGATSTQLLRINKSLVFSPDMAEFSSRGPVEGFGQVKPDISAPGVQVLAAVPPASVLGGLAVVLEGAPNYLHLDGTSMATPHMAGTAALVKQAHLDWTPDIIRTVLINTATNPRDQAGTPKGDGPTVADSIIAQGGGLIDVREAVNAKALMGVAGDGIEQPGILGSHSFGEVPVINNRTTHTETVTVTVRDLSGEGGTYNLAIANNRDLQIAGINVSLSQSSVTLQPNGTATYTVNATFDGDRIRDAVVNKGGGVFEPIQMQWFVTAKRSDNAESLRMPFYFKPGQSLPANATTQTLTQTGTVPVGDAGSQTASGVTYADVPFDVDASTFHVEATTSWLTIPDGSMPDVDYQLLDPDGHVIASSGAAGGPEHVSLNVSRAGTYTHRVVGYTNAATQFTITTLLTKGPAPTALGAIAGDFTNAQGKPVDFDGNLNLSWQAVGGATAYEVERSTDGTNYSVVASVTGTSASLTNEPNGQLSYRVRALTPGQIGTYVGAASNTVSVIVDRRSEVDITSLVSTAMSNVTFTNGVFSLDLNMKNNSTATYVPLVNLNVVRISSTSGTVSAKNADNGGSGVSANAPALYGYSNLLGSDQQFSPAETTGNRNVQFNDPASEMFTFDVQVTAYQSGSGGAGSNAPASGGGTSGGGTNGSSSSSLLPLTKVMRITVNPLTKTVAAKLF